jgi:Tfp pilus assembly pilus retraction ATPase PilT
MAALIQEVNLAEMRHIVTIESPIEYVFKPQRAYIRQREVGRDTPSFEQALIDAMREDPDVLMVGEMRDPQTMRLTLNAAETGHLVLATAHSATSAEALQRVVAAFPSEIQNSVCAQLADCLVAVVCQLAVSRRFAHSSPGMRDIASFDSCGEKFYSTRRVFQNDVLHGNRRGSGHVDLSTLPDLDGN